LSAGVFRNHDASNRKRELKMGAGSEREHGIFSEKTPPLGACPHFQRGAEDGPARRLFS
jgi:hypothetical protein